MAPDYTERALPSRPPLHLRAAPILLALAMLGAIRSIGHVPIFLGYVSAVAGVIWLALTLQISRFLLPSYLLLIWGIASLASNGLGAFRYVQLAVVLGGIGIAEMVSRMRTSDIANYVARRLVWIILVLICTEAVMIALGLGRRTRELDEALTGGLLPSLGIEVPRFMGTMGGSGYSACMAGGLGFLCLAEGKKRAAAILFVVSILMVSRGPLIALVAAFLFFAFRRFLIVRRVAFGAPLLAAAFPIAVWWLMNALSVEQILFLIELSTRRFLHYMSFLHFGLDNPLFGIGYANFRDAYLDYFFDGEFQQWGERTNTDLIREAHNFMLDILGEMGVVAWLLASAQLLMTGWKALRGDARYGAMFLYIVICFFFLSGLSNWTYWLMVGLVMSHTRMGVIGRTMPQQAEPNHAG